MPVPYFFRLLLLGLLSQAWALSLCAQFPPISFGRLTTEQGLSQDLVTTIAQDRLGFIWFGTLDGLTRYDGRRCLVMRRMPGDSASLPDNRITGLTNDVEGKLWISTFKGICYLQPETRRIQRVPVPSPTNPGTEQQHYFSNIAFDKNGIAWTVTDSFLLRLDISTMHARYFRIPCQVKEEIQVFADSRGRIWITVIGRHLLYFDTRAEGFTYVRGLNKPNGDPNPWPMWIQEDSKGTIWNGDWDKAFYTFDESRKQFIDLPEGGGIATVFILDESKGKSPVFWAGGGAHGLWRMERSSLRRTEFPPNSRDPYTHNNTRVYALYRDPVSGIVWIGTELGVEYYDPNGIQFERIWLPEKPGQTQFHGVSGLVPDADDPMRYWVSVWAVGLFEWNRRTGTFQLYDQEHKRIHSNEIFDMARDASGNLWLATWKGLERFDPRTRQNRLFPQPAPWNTVTDKTLSVEVGPDGRIWSGNNRGGLVETDPRSGTSRIIPIRPARGITLPPYMAWDIKLDVKGRVMVCSSNGLLRYDPSTGNTDHLLHRNPPLNVTDAVSGMDGRLFVGTSEGVYVLDGSDSLLFVLNTENGMVNQFVRKIERDQRGDIWIATTNGLHRYRSGTGKIEYFSKADGLFVTDHVNGFRAMPNGELFVSGNYSFNIGLPHWLAHRSRPPRLALDALLAPVRKEPVIPGQTFTLKPHENTVSFQVAALDFDPLREPVIVYRLIGFDNTWKETDHDIITYTNLDGGRYTLEVRARSEAGAWSKETLSIPFRVKPVFYKSWQFAAILALLAVGILWIIARYRRRVRLRLDAMRTRAAALEKQQLLNEIAMLKTQVNPHFLFNSLSILSSLVHTDADLSEQFIAQLSRSYRYILEQKDHALVSLRTELDFIRSYAFLLRIRFGDKMDLHIHIADEFMDVCKIAPLTLQLLIENAVKHNRMSAREPLIIEIFLESEALVVKNPLRSRPSKMPSTGTGLSNIISRYALITDLPIQAGPTADGFFLVKVPLL